MKLVVSNKKLQLFATQEQKVYFLGKQTSWLALFVLICLIKTNNISLLISLHRQINQQQTHSRVSCCRECHVFSISRCKLKFGSIFVMTAPVFSKDFFLKPSRDYEVMLKTFQAAVMSARSAHDETIKQVRKWFSFLLFVSCRVWEYSTKGFVKRLGA